MTRKKKITALIMTVGIVLICAFPAYLITKKAIWHWNLSRISSMRTDPDNPEPGTYEIARNIFLRGIIKPGMTYDEVIAILGVPTNKMKFEDVIPIFGVPTEKLKRENNKMWCRFPVCSLDGKGKSYLVIFNHNGRAGFAPHPESPGSKVLQSMPTTIYRERSDPNHPEPGTCQIIYHIFSKEIIKPGMTYDEAIAILGSPTKKVELKNDKVRCEFKVCVMTAGKYESYYIYFDHNGRVEFVPHPDPVSHYLQFHPPPGSYKQKKG